MFEEIDQTPKNWEEVEREILDNCETLSRTIKESMRIMSPVLRNAPRVVRKNITVCGKIIYKGDMVFINGTAMNFNPKIHKDPDVFDIDRFSEENEKKLPRNSYIPFSVGKRNCVGQYLGQLMAKITISRFLKNFDIEEVEGFEYRKTSMPIYGYEKAMVDIKIR